MFFLLVIELNNDIIIFVYWKWIDNKNVYNVFVFEMVFDY